MPDAAGKEPWGSSDAKAKELTIADFGTPDEVSEMAQMPRTAKTYDEVREILQGIIDKPLTGKSGLTATISKKSIKEMLSGEAVGKSIDFRAHLKAAANVDKLFENAIEKWKFELDPNKNNEGLQDRKYLYAPMEYSDLIVPVKLTIKEYKAQSFGKRLYSVEAIDVVIK
jgi:hypothetical protein